MTRYDSESYYNLFKIMFEVLQNDQKQFQFEFWHCFGTDFSIPQINGLRKAVNEIFGESGSDHLKKILRGCVIHWQRSCKKVSLSICSNDSDTKKFLDLSYNLVRQIVDHAKEILNLIRELWSGSKDWVNWWL